MFATPKRTPLSEIPKNNTPLRKSITKTKEIVSINLFEFKKNKQKLYFCFKYHFMASFNDYFNLECLNTIKMLYLSLCNESRIQTNCYFRKQLTMKKNGVLAEVWCKCKDECQLFPMHHLVLRWLVIVKSNYIFKLA